MAKTPALRGLLAGLLVLAGATAASAEPTVAEVLSIKPKQKDVAFSTPTTADEQKSCKVELEKGAKPGASAWVLRDAQKRVVRRFAGNRGEKFPPDTWSWYQNGVEVYREIDTNGDGIPDHFRWLNAGGMKWGIDLNNDGKIDYWSMISPEEVGFEAFQAVAQNDLNRLKALYISQKEMQAVKLSSAEVTRLSMLQKQAEANFAKLTKEVDLSAAKFEHVEARVAGCVPAEDGGADLIHYDSRAILFLDAAKKHAWLHTGELIQVGLAWRLVELPSTKDPTGGSDTTPPPEIKGNAEFDKLITKLTDEDNANSMLDPRQPAGMKYLARRTDLLMLILNVADPKQRDTWYRQLFDNLSTMAQNGHAKSLSDLAGYRAQVVKAMPKTELAACVTYREMWTRYLLALAEPKADVRKIQEQWQEQLAGFVKDYSQAEDTPDALYQLAIGAEHYGKDDEAKRWYSQVATGFSKSLLAKKCEGAARRLDLPGKKLELSGARLDSPAKFDMSELKDKAVVVYYWASRCNECLGDFARLKKLREANEGKVELVLVNLDDTAEKATTYLKGSQVPGIHLFEAPPKDLGGMSSPLAEQYGIHYLPTVFIVGRDGRVLRCSMQLGEVESEMKKALTP